MKPEEVVRHWYEAWNRHDIDAVVAMLAPDFVEYSPANPGPIRGKAAYRRAQEPELKAVPDFKANNLNMVAGGDTVGVEVEFVGTFKGPLEILGRMLPPTGRRIRGKWAEFDRISADNLIVEQRVYIDLASLLRQFGLKA